MDNRNISSEVNIPEEWHPNNDWDSHRPMLWMALGQVPITAFYEFGLGYGSTPLLCEYFKANKFLEYYSFESNIDWFKIFIEGYSPNQLRTKSFINDRHCIVYTDNYLQLRPSDKSSIAFIDSAPGEHRKGIIKNFKDCTVIIVHDTEPGAEYVYGMSEILSTFKYRCDLVIEGMPQTTAVSNVYDVSTWKGVYNDKFHFV